ncbi:MULTISPECIES: MFS transporter [Bacteroides]|uniref:MFS transporter n=1 Tax=Bacteroides TaxID=816 RepID=UPI000E450CE7|nr:MULTISPECIES: MFS transporter [Bacteroides]MBS7573025.1 MFS transporter [Bacteroides propionicigenes]RGM29195.1 MFS transporter [Bacteroides sp. OM08-17BH]RHJ55051.1 MFS transporter [Bacteroides sp. AM10-21B]HBO06746.1 MFS transporter [Bacteroides sp.]
MSTIQNTLGKMTNYRWTICAMLFFATTVNYLDRQVLSLTWDEFIKPEFHWDESHYGTITAVFSFVYAACMLFAGRFVDWLGSKKGYLWAIGVWSLGACLHAFCGIITEHFVGLHSAAELMGATGDVVVTIATISMYCFLAARCVLALGEAGNFPAAIKVTAEYFPKKDRAYATSIFNAGASIGALIAPLSIPLLAKAWGWEMAFIVIGVLGFIWMGFWVFMYTAPAKSKHVNKAELEYIEQDNHEEGQVESQTEGKKMGFLQCFGYKQTWAFAIGKFMTDGVWWFFLFWTPSYLNTQFGIKTSDGLGIALIFTLYAITMLSIYGGKLPSIIIKKTGLNPYAARMRAMLIFAFFPLLVLLAQPLGTISPWFPVILIGIGGAAHQSWSANIFSTVGDMFPKTAIATVTGIGGMAGGIGCMVLQYVAGELFVYAGETNMAFIGFEGKPAGYFVIFCVCAVAYLIGWCIMKALVPKYKPIVLN